MRKPRLLTAALTLPLAAGLVVTTASAASAQEPALSGPATEFTVLTAEGQSVDAATRDIRDAGGTVLRANRAIGLITVTAPANGFTARLADSSAVEGAAKARPIGSAPRARGAGERLEANEAVEKENKHAGDAGSRASGRAGTPDAATTDPLDEKLWGLKSVRSDLARTVQPGDKRVKVGVIDTGVDGSHPDIAPNFDKADSRNFTRDIPTDETGAEVDGPCEFRGCVDPADHDDNGHGTHVAGTIAAAVNGTGISGVAPDVSLVNVRAGQDSGNFFLQPSVDAITYAADAGIDVINMSFYVDPWLYNCAANPADSPEQQAAQRVTIEAVNRALDYAHDGGVTSVVALGNQHSDLGAPQPDTSSPNYPADSAHDRDIDNASCVSLPTEGEHTISVSAFGPSQAKADYSNYGEEQISVSAPGGYYRDYFGSDDYSANENMILSAYPRNVAVADGNVDANGRITPEGKELGVQRARAADGTVGYYQYLQGTSMATPHATGVAALIVSQFGRPGVGGFGMDPDDVESVLTGTASNIPCPVPSTVDYLDEGRDDSYTATCTGTTEFNGFYGHGAVDAYSAVRHGGEHL